MARTTISKWVREQKLEKLRPIYIGSILELGNRVQEDTPFDKGRARASWSHSGPITFGVIHRFTSNLEYIIPLEYGHSDQAPNGMLRRNARNWNAIVREQL